jgi:hypothetical protein
MPGVHRMVVEALLNCLSTWKNEQILMDDRNHDRQVVFPIPFSWCLPS